MLLSNSSVYGLRAAVLLASKKNRDFITIRELSDELNISFYFLTKVLQQLTKSEILISYKGPNGGVKLARPGNSITFMDIIISIEGEKIFRDCAFGLNKCELLQPCPLRKDWQQLQANIKELMESSTLQELADGTHSKLFSNHTTEHRTENTR